MAKTQVYVDGSWLAGRVGYGFVILRDGEILHEAGGRVPDEKVSGTRQVAGELFAVGLALQWCRENGLEEVHLYYDYAGIEAWATGKWKAKQELTQRYRDFVQRQPVRVHWHKVKAHTGDTWNERADQLAKVGAGG